MVLATCDRLTACTTAHAREHSATKPSTHAARIPRGHRCSDSCGMHVVWRWTGRRGSMCTARSLMEGRRKRVAVMRKGSWMVVKTRRFGRIGDMWMMSGLGSMQGTPCTPSCTILHLANDTSKMPGSCTPKVTGFQNSNRWWLYYRCAGE
jgi:hypothetical protein